MSGRFTIVPSDRSDDRRGRSMSGSNLPAPHKSQIGCDPANPLLASPGERVHWTLREGTGKIVAHSAGTDA